MGILRLKINVGLTSYNHGVVLLLLLSSKKGNDIGEKEVVTSLQVRGSLN